MVDVDQRIEQTGLAVLAEEPGKHAFDLKVANRRMDGHEDRARALQGLGAKNRRGVFGLPTCEVAEAHWAPPSRMMTPTKECSALPTS